MKMQTKYNYKKPEGTSFEGQKSKTEQHHANDFDINTIIKRAQKTGLLTGHPVKYQDLSSIPDFQEAQETIAKAKELFYSLPSHIRNRFENDPGKLLSFAQNPYNRLEAEALGLIEKQPVQAEQSPSVDTTATATDGA